MIVTCLLGNPTNHSISPLLFNLYADKHNIDYAHIKFNIQEEDISSAIKNLSTFGFAGANITIPYKSIVMNYLDLVTEGAAKIGAVNTIQVLNKKTIGYNTDLMGAILSIENKLCRPLNKEDVALVFGTGGAARAIVWGLISKGVTVIVCYRTPKSCRTLSIEHDFLDKVAFLDYQELTKFHFEASNIICNATSAGMTPEIDNIPFPKSIIPKIKNLSHTVVFDAIFNPRITFLQKIAKKKGAKIALGIDMMIYQGVFAFEHWTGLETNNQTILEAKKILHNHL